MRDDRVDNEQCNANAKRCGCPLCRLHVVFKDQIKNTVSNFENLFAFCCNERLRVHSLQDKKSDKMMLYRLNESRRDFVFGCNTSLPIALHPKVSYRAGVPMCRQENHRRHMRQPRTTTSTSSTANVSTTAAEAGAATNKRQQNQFDQEKYRNARAARFFTQHSSTLIIPKLDSFVHPSAVLIRPGFD
jgi:hypothetical protein